MPKLPTGGNKRKLPDNPTPELLKKLKLESNSTSDITPSTPNIGVGSVRKATVEDIEDENDIMNYAPGGDADYFAEEDEEGRFYGGGLTSEQKEILNIFEKAEGTFGL